MKPVASVFFLLVFVLQTAFASFQVNVSTTGTPLSARLYPKAVALSDGTVFINGGNGGTGASADFALFDTKTLTYLPTPLISDAPKLFAHAAAVDENDNIYYFGGNNGTSRTNALWTCNVLGGGCTKLTPSGTLPGVRTLSSMVYWQNSLVLFGGGNSPSFYNDVWQYEIDSNTWINRVVQGDAGSPPGRTATCGAIYGDELVISGGARTNPFPTTYYQDTWILDLNTWTWTNVTANTIPSVVHSDAACTVIGDLFLLYGGSSGSGTISKTLDMFRVPSRTWLAYYEDTDGVARYGVAHAFVAGKWYLFGGSTSATNLNTLEVYTPDEYEYSITDSSDDTNPTTSTSAPPLDTYSTVENNPTAVPGCNPPTPIVSVVNSSTFYVLPSQPSVSVSYDGSGSLLFQVAVDFVQDQASYFLDFAPSDVLNATGSFCSNHYYGYGSFYDAWQSPPDYISAAYGNYGTWPGSHYWYKNSLLCNRINYYANIPINGCSDQFGRPLISASTEGDKIVFEGTLFIALNRAHDIYASDKVDNLVTWKQFFRLELSNVVATVSSLNVEGEGDMTPRVDPARIGISETGGLVLQITSELKEPTPSGTADVRAGNPVVLFSPVGLVLNVNNSDNNSNGPACVSPCTQTWTWNSQTNSPDYSGVYRFQFTVLSATNKRFAVGSTFSVSLQIQLKPTATLYLNASSIPATLNLYRSNFYYVPAYSFGAKERVYAIQSISTSLSIQLALKNAWLCYDAVWNPMAGQMGCLSASPSKVVQLVSNGNVLNYTTNQPYGASFSNYAVGLSFVAVPLSPNPQNYLLHIESTVQTIGKKRNTETTTKQQVISFTVDGNPPTQETIEEEVGSGGSTLASSILFFATLTAAVSFVVSF